MVKEVERVEKVEGVERNLGSDGRKGKLAVVAAGEAFEGKVLVEIRPVDAETGHFHAGELRGGAGGEPAIAGNGKTHQGTAVENDGHESVFDGNGPKSFDGEDGWHGDWQVTLVSGARGARAGDAGA